MINMVYLKGNLKRQFKEQIRQIWSNLSEDEIAFYEVRPDAFFRAIEQKYGMTKESAQKILHDLQLALQPEVA